MTTKAGGEERGRTSAPKDRGGTNLGDSEVSRTPFPPESRVNGKGKRREKKRGEKKRKRMKKKKKKKKEEEERRYGSRRSRSLEIFRTRPPLLKWFFGRIEGRPEREKKSFSKAKRSRLALPRDATSGPTCTNLTMD